MFGRGEALFCIQFPKKLGCPIERTPICIKKREVKFGMSKMVHQRIEIFFVATNTSYRERLKML
jgi:hypothetical protein